MLDVLQVPKPHVLWVFYRYTSS